jgi:dihydrolipoamide dehydrogenase
VEDLIIIGGGPGGYVAAIRARQLGMKVVLAEKAAYGGTCLNHGCIPTKAYYQNASVLRTIKSSQEYNLKIDNHSFDMAAALQRKNHIVAGSVANIEKVLQANGVERVMGTATLVDKNKVQVNGQTLKARHILIATGSRPASPALPGADLPGVLNSDQLLELNMIPDRLAIIGGGVVGLEFACIFNAFGSQVTVFEYLPELLNSMDHELGKRLRVFLKKQSIAVHTSATVEKIESWGRGLKLTATAKKQTVETEADIILFAGGRKPNTQGLNLDKLGIALDEAGFIKVDQNFATNVEGIYAVGDVIGGMMLAHVASEEGIIAVENIAGHSQVMDYNAIPACVFTFPEIASVGMTEEQAKSKGLAYRTGKFQFAANGKAQTMGEPDGMVKVLADQNDVIIGMHIIGPHASDLIMEGTMMVKNRMKIADVIATVHPHPTLTEAILEAVLDIQGQSIHLLPSRRQVRH